MNASRVEQFNHFMRSVVYLGLVAVGLFVVYEASLMLHKDEDELAAAQEKTKKLSSDLKEKEDTITQQGKRLQDQKKTITEQIRDIEKKQQEIKELTVEVERITTALRFMKMDRPLARVEILEQTAPSDAPEKVRTKVRFVQVDSQDNPISEPVIATVEGKELYVEARKIVFHDEFVELGDALRGRPIWRFKRMFGERQSPIQGIPLDSEPASPGETTDFEKRMWRNFDEYANNKAKADRDGVAVANSSAPSVTVHAGEFWRVKLRATGQLSLVPDSKPDDDAPKLNEDAP
ncbi:MAG: hypothetical protein N2C14_16430 [Planctomycetales bacterium]